jgi:hypothetical protein
MRRVEVEVERVGKWASVKPSLVYCYPNMWFSNDFPTMPSRQKVDLSFTSSLHHLSIVYLDF